MIPPQKPRKARRKVLSNGCIIIISNMSASCPPEFTKYIDEDGPDRIAADYIACMTDRYAVRDYTRLFVPADWADLSNLICVH